MPYLITFFLLCIQLAGHAQIDIDTTQTPEFLVKKILKGSGVLIGNVKFTGERHAIGLYSDSTRQMGITKGVLLTSGNAFYVIGPNKSPRSGWASNAPGDDELDEIARGKTYDASVLEFDFVTASENLSFRYLFASEEYLEYVGSKFNDVFAFFIEGPGVGKLNIARLPDGKTPITVNTVNNASNAQYYIDNTYTNVFDPFVWDVRNRKVVANKHYMEQEVLPRYNTQFDGFTVVLKAECRVQPNQVYHIKLAISDVGDGILDSGVFLEAGSFESYGDQLIALEDDYFSETVNAPAKIESKPLELAERYPVPNIPHRMELGKVEFAFDDHHLNEAGQLVIKEAYNRWREHPESRIELLGHTDSYGSEAYNIILSEKRSETVAKALMARGIPGHKIAINYYGESFPLNPNNTLFGRARNRRVELFLTY